MVGAHRQKYLWLGGAILGIVLGSCGFPFLLDSHSQELGQTLPISAELVLANERVVELEVAKTPAEQSQGLMFRSQLPPERGMLFDFDSPRVARFWMKNTLIPLDMIFLREGKIKAILEQIPPCKSDPCPVYGPWMEVDQVLELGAGQAQNMGIKVGDRLTIRPR
jgi:hypothetical protein